MKTKPGYVYDICPECKGEGLLPPIGVDSETEFNIKNVFPRPCDSCGGGGRRYIKIDTETKTP